MALILNIESATKNCSVSLSENNVILSIKELNDGGYTHGENLHVFIEQVVKAAGKTLKDLDALAVSKGPGSYTGLRIGVAAAKGLCYALDIPLISISTLATLAAAYKAKNNCFIIPLLDARRMEVYSAVYDQDQLLLREIEAEIISASSFERYLKEQQVYFLGDGAEKCKDLILHKNAVFLKDHFPSSKELAILAFEKYQKKEFEDLAYFEPYYLKEFLVTKSKKRM